MLVSSMERGGSRSSDALEQGSRPGQMVAGARGDVDDGHLNDGLLIGPRLRRARQRRKLSLEDLARATGLTKGFISQLEREMTSVSVASLVRLCDAIGITVGSLFQPSEEVLTSLATAPLINFGGSGLHEQLLTPRASSDLMIIRSEIEPGGGSGAEPYVLNAKTEAVHVLEGQLVLTLDEDEYSLRAGDTLTFSPRRHHAWRNLSETAQAIVLWVLAPSP
jgi:transcriptional regulator with XRE-family HTH domain